VFALLIRGPGLVFFSLDLCSGNTLFLVGVSTVLCLVQCSDFFERYSL
jgi:hypothetical protein